ncbi:MAG: site-specific integrase [Lachnospiraceae bacterium]|nr:site-specific integrase [Lachnospiraceae bacterium]
MTSINSVLVAANRFLAMLHQTICAMGIRVSEIQCLTVKALQGGEIDIYNKGKERIVLIPPKLRMKLLAYMKRLVSCRAVSLCSGTANLWSTPISFAL